MNTIYKVAKQFSILVIGLTLSMQSFAEPLITSEASQKEKIVVEFYDKIFVQHKGDVRKVAEQLVHEGYIQHNPWVATGREAFITAFSRVVKNRPATQTTVLKRVMTSGDYVVLHVHSFDTNKKGPGSAGVDTFRVVDGKIIEHWDVWQKIPEKMPHDNGMI
jgi:predicted SnoaL-like aldol condensation-catalyzing enzyme